MSVTACICVKEISRDVVGLDNNISDSGSSDGLKSQSVLLHIFNLEQFEQSSVNLVVRKAWGNIVLELNQEFEFLLVLINLVQF